MSGYQVIQEAGLAICDNCKRPELLNEANLCLACEAVAEDRQQACASLRQQLEAARDDHERLADLIIECKYTYGDRFDDILMAFANAVPPESMAVAEGRYLLLEGFRDSVAVLTPEAQARIYSRILFDAQRRAS